jgi:hypothetical protein
MSRNIIFELMYNVINFQNLSSWAQASKLTVLSSVAPIKILLRVSYLFRVYFMPHTTYPHWLNTTWSLQIMKLLNM